MSNKVYEITDGVESLVEVIASVKGACNEFATYTQEQVDAIFLAAATAANRQRISLAKMAVEETGMGVVEDKVIKNHYAAEYIYNKYRDTKTCGILEEDKANGILKIAEPIGVKSVMTVLRYLKNTMFGGTTLRNTRFSGPTSRRDHRRGLQKCRVRWHPTTRAALFLSTALIDDEKSTTNSSPG